MSAAGLLPGDAATHALTSVYLVPLVLVVGIRMLPRVSAYPIRFPVLCGGLVWCGLLGGLLRAFGGTIGGALGWQVAWLGGLLVTLAVLIFAALAWSPWGRADRRSARAGGRSALAPPPGLVPC